jgi:hypothetical protein
MSKSRMLLAAAVAALAVMLIGGAGPAAAQTSPKLAKTVKLAGTAKGGKKFSGTYTIQRFTRSGGKVLAVGTVKGKVKGKKVTKKNVKIPVTLQRHEGATTSQAPDPTEGACQILDLVLQPIDLNLLGLHVATSRIEALIEAVPGSGALLGNLLCAITGILDPQASPPATPGVLTQVLNALLAILPRTA